MFIYESLIKVQQQEQQQASDEGEEASHGNRWGGSHHWMQNVPEHHHTSSASVFYQPDALPPLRVLNQRTSAERLFAGPRAQKKA
jgi:hypothetical protein